MKVFVLNEIQIRNTYHGTSGKRLYTVGRKCGSFSQLTAGKYNGTSPAGLQSYGVHFKMMFIDLGHH